MTELYLPPAGDPLTRGTRVEGWRVELLTSNDAPVGDLPGVTGGVIEQNVNAIIRGGGTLELDNLGQDIDWLTARIKVWWEANDVEWPLGVFLLSSPVSTYADGLHSWSVEILDKLVILDQDKVDGSYSAPAGAVVTDQVRAIIESTGESSGSITDSAETLVSGMVWEAGTSKLRIVNDLLSAVNYFSLRADGHGRYLAEPYVRPQDRANAWEFQEGQASVQAPDFMRDEDLASVPNKVVLVSTATGDQPAFVSVATNEDPLSPFSYQRRGRWIVYTENSVEATSQGVLDALAWRKLADLSSTSATLEIGCAALPLELNNAVGFSQAGVETRGVVQKTSLALSIGAQMAVTVREVEA